MAISPSPVSDWASGIQAGEALSRLDFGTGGGEAGQLFLQLQVCGVPLHTFPAPVHLFLLAFAAFSLILSLYAHSVPSTHFPDHSSKTGSPLLPAHPSLVVCSFPLVSGPGKEGSDCQITTLTRISFSVIQSFFLFLLRVQ